jgi:hypothetical protein
MGGPGPEIAGGTDAWPIQPNQPCVIFRGQPDQFDGCRRGGTTIDDQDGKPLPPDGLQMQTVSSMAPSLKGES